MRRRVIGKVLLPVVSIALLLLLWEVIVIVSHVQSYIVPRPLASIQAVTGNWGNLSPLVYGIVRETIYGFIGGAVLGFCFGVVMSKVSWVQKLLYPQLILSQAVPVIAIAFPLVAILGFNSIRPIIAIVVWTVFFPVTVNVFDGLGHVDPDLMNLAKVYGASKWRTFWLIEVPATVSPLFSGLKIGATYAITGAFIGELVSPQGSSLAQTVNTANGHDSPATVFGLTMLLAVIGVTFFLVVTWAEVLATPWQRRSIARRSRRNNVATPQNER
jgi:ABC-type nitrate/sulfonate/bicarbonate transport system permease component